MRLWQRRVLGVLALGGSFLGLSIGFEQLFASVPLLSKVLCMPFLGLYAWGIWCGMALFEGADGAFRSNRRFWALQIPVLSSPIAGYTFASGCLLTISFQPAGARFNFGARFGSQFGYSLLQSEQPLAVGFNVVAVGVCLFLTRCIRRQEPALLVGTDPVLGPAPSG